MVAIPSKDTLATRFDSRAFRASVSSKAGKPICDCMRFMFFVAIKMTTLLFYRFKVKHLPPWPQNAWKDVRLLVLLNHTSLLEPLYFGALPLSYLWSLARQGAFPAADVSMQRPIVGRLLGSLSPKVVTISRKRDDSWQQFMAAITAEDVLVFMPEGRMKRANGLDKHGKPMTVRGGIVDVMLQRPTGKMIIAYSGGLHHLESPGSRLPKLFQSLSLTFEAMNLEDSTLPHLLVHLKVEPMLPS